MPENTVTPYVAGATSTAYSILLKASPVPPTSAPVASVTVPTASTPISGTVAPASTEEPERIRFSPGATTGSASGALPASGSKVYVVAADAGQTMTVFSTTSAGNTNLSIWGADGTVLASGMGETDQWSGTLPLSEDYFIMVRADPNAGATYVLTVIIPPR